MTGQEGAKDTPPEVWEVWADALAALQKFRGPGGWLSLAQPGDAAGAVLGSLVARGLLRPTTRQPSG